MVYRKIPYQHRMLFMLLSSILLIFLVISTVRYFLKDIHSVTDKIITEHIDILAKIIETIDQKCRIIGFDHQKNYVDFLNVKSFSGSEIGSMNLMYPENWEGPYLETNLTIQEKPYMIVKTKFGYYLTPGEGVRLSNGKVIGEDIKLLESTDMNVLLNDPKALLSGSNNLAIKLDIKLNNDYDEKVFSALVEDEEYP